MKKNIPLNERIIFALDVASHDEAMQWVEKLDNDIKFFKIGLQLFLAGWFPTIDAIIARGNKVMVDLKFFDIPKTVQLAVDQLKNRGVTFATVHGNDPILQAATTDKTDLKILAITVLTSFGENDMQEMGMTGTVRDLVLLRAKKALALGCDGVVASALEANDIRRYSDDNFLIITPGIRPGSNIEDNDDDQTRIATAKQAIINGADYVVIGRPIRDSKDPIAMIQQLQAEIKLGLEQHTP
jgi:orotidine-5'-phosphate decarboxylase